MNAAVCCSDQCLGRSQRHPPSLGWAACKWVLGVFCTPHPSCCACSRTSSFHKHTCCLSCFAKPDRGFEKGSSTCNATSLYHKFSPAQESRGVCKPEGGRRSPRKIFVLLSVSSQEIVPLSSSSSFSVTVSFFFPAAFTRALFFGH